MTAVTFLEYLQQIFYPFLCAKGSEFPVVLFVDGHSSHFSFETTEFCAEKKIVLIALYPNSTHLIQPMDVAVFGPLKKSWRTAVHQWKYKNHNFKSLTKEHFAQLLHQTITKCVKPEYLQSGFKTSGLFPFNPDGINYEKLVGNYSHQDAEDDFQAGKREIERKKFATASECIREVINTEKELAFFDFFLSDNMKPWNGAIEDTTAYYIWREILQRSRSNEISAVVNEEEEDWNEEANAQNELFTEEQISDWNIDPNADYFENLEDFELEFVDKTNPIEGNSNDGRLICVLDDMLLVPPSVQAHSTFAIPNSEVEQHSIVDEDNRELTSAEPGVPVNSTDETSSFNTQQTQSVISMADLYNLPTAETPCQVQDVFLQCMKPQTERIEAEKTKEKFSLPKITGKISLNFTSAYESHYISCIDFTSGTSVVSSKWHREYVQEHKAKHELSAERRLQRKNKKFAAQTGSQEQEALRKSARERTNKYVLADVPSDVGITDEDDDFELKKTKKKKKKKSVGRPHKLLKPRSTPSFDTSLSSETSFSPEPKKNKSHMAYTTDEN